jgi:hypothetical protein
MSFSDEIKTLAGHVTEHKEHCRTEEATKQALIVPFIRILGYDVNDPKEVVPEFTADVDPKRSDRVDYAIMKDDKPIMMFECKAVNSNLEKDEKWKQLFLYFAATEVKFAILTNGVDYQFFSDLDKRNKMDQRPFLEFNLLNIDDSAIEELKRFTKEEFDPDDIRIAAVELKYTREINRILFEQLKEPSEEFIKFFTSRIYSGRKMRQTVIQRFSPLTRKAFKQFITDQAYAWMKSGPGNGNGASIREEADSDGVLGVENLGGPLVTSTTEEELQGYFIVKAILHGTIDLKRVQMRDYKAFCGVLLDDSKKKPICRLRFNSPQNKRLGLINEHSEEEQVPIEDLNDIYKYADRLKAAVLSYQHLTPTG